MQNSNSIQAIQTDVCLDYSQLTIEFQLFKLQIKKE